MSAAPHLSGLPVTIRRGALWVLGDDPEEPDAAPMFVEWAAPPTPGLQPTVVFVHGGGGQSLDWMLTADGRPGWAHRFVRSGYPVYLVDRPGHGRSRGAAPVGGVGAAASAEQLAWLFGGSTGGSHTQWPWPRDRASAQVRGLAAGAAPLAVDLAAAERREARRLVGLLERTGPAVLVTHSLGACAGWHAAARRPDLVRAIIAIDPAGPPYASIPGVGRLDGGLTVGALSDAQREPPMRGVDVHVVVGEVSPFRSATPAVVGHLTGLGARARLERLEEHGMRGNGHGVMLEANSDEIADFVDRLIRRSADRDD